LVFVGLAMIDEVPGDDHDIGQRVEPVDLGDRARQESGGIDPAVDQLARCHDVRIGQLDDDHWLLRLLPLGSILAVEGAVAHDRRFYARYLGPKPSALLPTELAGLRRRTTRAGLTEAIQCDDKRSAQGTDTEFEPYHTAYHGQRFSGGSAFAPAARLRADACRNRAPLSRSDGC